LVGSQGSFLLAFQLGGQACLVGLRQGALESPGRARIKRVFPCRPSLQKLKGLLAGFFWFPKDFH
jgi:hypothetical protein